MQTSYYAIASKREGAIAISRKVPKWAQPIPQYLPLAPGRWHHSISEVEYKLRYQSTLAGLNPAIVWKTLENMAYPHEPILLCYEKSADFCHRHLVAAWFKDSLGKEVTELTLAAVQAEQNGAEQLSLSF